MKHIDNNTEDPNIRPFLQTGLVFNEQPSSSIEQTDYYNEQLSSPQPAEFCDPSTSIQCPPASSETRPVQKMLRYKPETFSMTPRVPTDSHGVPVMIAAPSAPSFHPRTPTFQKMFTN